MTIWIAKAIIQKSISFLPYNHRINYLFQKYVTKGVVLSDYLMEDKLTHCSNHLKFYFRNSAVKNGFSSLEIGTGWYPIIPIGLYLAGADNIYTIDISGLLKTNALKDTIRKFIEYSENGKLATYLPFINQKRLQKLSNLLSIEGSPEKLLEQINVKPIIGDARKINLPDASFDLINSNNTFEHIYPGILLDILREFKRLQKPSGIMSHFIDMSDHFAHLDKSITIYNYLQYSDTTWGIIDNSIQPQNRLRITDYRQLYADAGLKIIDEMIDPGSIEALQRVTLAPKYKNIAPKDLAVSHCLLISTINTT